jgi:hypothetical protein
MAYGHAERNLVLIVAVTCADQVVQALPALRASNSPDDIPMLSALISAEI